MMMAAGYSAKGWLGLILGTRMWYPFWDADQDNDTAFERRLDAVVREIGDRGKLRMSEAVPPEPTPAPAPADAHVFSASSCFLSPFTRETGASVSLDRLSSFK